MKKFLLGVSISLVCLLMGCDEEVPNSGIDELINTNDQIVSSKNSNNDFTSSSDASSGMTLIENNGETYQIPTLEEINANAYDAEKMGPKTLELNNDYQVDIVVGDDYYATQIADMSLDFDKYEGKVIEIEGMALKEGPYTFVGRYSENAICPTCPVGFAFYEFEWHGEEQIDFGEQKNWIKVIGKLTRGNDGNEYYYIDAYRIDIMDHWGEVPTVVN